ncbi:MAG: shikimate dehydrogenase [Rhodospirillaceae bacterium]|nr:shikimate dehydrogenase [Rhodospirillaceae bacterium]
MAISGKARLAGVIGWPVGHSKSPALHSYWIAKHGLDAAYVPLAVRPERLKDALTGLVALGFAGANLTIPHKQAALALLDDITPTAARIGAVNTLFIDANGRITGTNTDAFGFLANLKHAVTGFDGAGAAVVIGAGGAARAACVALIDAGCASISVINRTAARAEALAADLGGPVRVVPWAGRAAALGNAALLVNTTSLGMTGQPPLDLDLKALPAGAVVNDLVYSPLETPLLAAARRSGNPVVDGLGMLLYQAQAGFAGWFGVTPEVTADLRAHVMNADVLTS